MQEALEEERRQAAEDRQKLLVQITALMTSQADVEETRRSDRTSSILRTIGESNTSTEAVMSQCTQGLETWNEKENVLMEDVKKSREQLKTKLKDDWTVTSDQSTAIQNMTKSIHAETARVAEEQTVDLDTQMEALDDFASRAKSKSASHHESHTQSLLGLSNTVEQSFGHVSAHCKTTLERIKNLGEGMELDSRDLQDSLEPLAIQICQPLSNLREGIAATSLQEYQPTGDTPQKATYRYPTKLPRTQGPDLVVGESDGAGGDNDEQDVSMAEDADASAADSSTLLSVGVGVGVTQSSPITTRHSIASSTMMPDNNNTKAMSLREVNPNVTTHSLSSAASSGGALVFDPRASTMSMPAEYTVSKKPAARLTARGGGFKKQSILVEGRENMVPAALGAALSKRKSPRLN